MAQQIRPGAPNDSAEILEVIIDAYELPPDSLRIPRNRGLAENAPDEFRLMVQAGRIVALLHIGDTWIQVGECAVLKGDVGHVAVRREMQGKGLGSALMREAVSWMRANGYHLSRLGGLMHFYSRFGYERFLRRFVEFHVRDMQGGKRQVTAAEAFPQPLGFPGVLRPYDEARDWRARAQIRYAFDHGRSGAARVSPDASPPASPAPPDPERLAFVYELEGEIKGYLFATEAPLEAKEGEACFSIGDFAYLPECPQAAGLLLRQLLARLTPHAPARVTSRLPFDDQLAITLQDAGVGFQRIEMHQTVAGNMIQVLNLRATLEAIAPELSDRLAASPVSDWSGLVEFALPAETASLRIADGRVAVAEDGDCDVRLEMTQAEFVKLLFGINAFDELPVGRTADRVAQASSLREGPNAKHPAQDPPEGPDCNPASAGAASGLVLQLALLKALFPRCQSGSGPWG